MSSYIKLIISCLVLHWHAESQFGGKEYAISDFLTNWEDAELVCVTNDARLASVATAEEDSYLRNQLSESLTA